MFRFGIRLALVAALAGACSSPSKPVKHAHKTVKAPAEKPPLEQAHDAEAAGETDEADEKYLEAYNQAKSFDARRTKVAAPPVSGNAAVPSA